MSDLSISSAMSRQMMMPTTGRESLEEMRERKHEELQAKIDSGEIDLEEFQAKLIEDFGSDAEGIVAEDGTIDFDKLDALMESNPPPSMEGMDGMENMPPPPPPPGADALDSTEFQENLIAEFGEEAEGIVAEDGTINFAKLDELLSSKLETANEELSAINTDASEDTTALTALMNILNESYELDSSSLIGSLFHIET